MALKRFTDNERTPEKKDVSVPLTSSKDNTDYYATGGDMAEIVLNNTARLWDLKAKVIPTCRSFRDPEYLQAGSWFFEDISNTEDKPDKLKEKKVQFARLLCESGQSKQEGLKFIKQYLFYINMTDNELELSMRGVLLNGSSEVQGATPWKTGVDEADVAKNAKSADIATSVIDNVKNQSKQTLATTDDVLYGSYVPLGYSGNAVKYYKIDITAREAKGYSRILVNVQGSECVLLSSDTGDEQYINATLSALRLTEGYGKVLAIKYKKTSLDPNASIYLKISKYTSTYLCFLSGIKDYKAATITESEFNAVENEIPIKENATQEQPSYDYKSLYPTVDNTERTIEDFIKILVDKGGFQCGSSRIYSDNLNLVLGWYNYIWLPHRTGEILSGDEKQYGTLVLFGIMTRDDNKIYLIKYYAGQIQHPVIFEGIQKTSLQAYNQGITKEI